jgi:alkanesulfonate monooxygenase SsuD/methylene tetrahydromethanopterin reductase-like flavin-dependent oxidoreductase (luciferase family)
MAMTCVRSRSASRWRFRISASTGPARWAAQFARVRAAAEERGRPAHDLVCSNALVVCAGRDDAEVARRAAAIGREVDELKANGLAGTPAEIVDRIGRYQEVGSQRIYLQILDLDDLDHLELVASHVKPQLG